MCGIAGWIGIPDPAPDLTERLIASLRHRGPMGPAARPGRERLIHTRLSIIDLSPSGRQPMSNEDGSVWIVFNGEIYNHHELRADLNSPVPRTMTRRSSGPPEARGGCRVSPLKTIQTEPSSFDMAARPDGDRSMMLKRVWIRPAPGQVSRPVPSDRDGAARHQAFGEIGCRVRDPDPTRDPAHGRLPSPSAGAGGRLDGHEEPMDRSAGTASTRRHAVSDSGARTLRSWGMPVSLRHLSPAIEAATQLLQPDRSCVAVPWIGEARVVGDEHSAGPQHAPDLGEYRAP